MDTQNYKNMKMISSPNKSLLSKAKFLWKTLVVLILSVLLFAPTPALALDYNGTLQTYVSTTKVEIDGVLTSIKTLPNLSYENGKTILAEIDNKLQKIQTNAGKNAKDFHNLSNQTQKEYEQVLDKLKNLKEPEIPRITKMLSLENTMKMENYLREKQLYFELINGADSKIKKLSNGIVLADKISRLCDDLEKRVNLAKQKSGNVKEYADVLQSFNDPDILSEIADLNTFVANLTNNLTIAS